MEPHTSIADNYCKSAITTILKVEGRASIETLAEKIPTIKKSKLYRKIPQLVEEGYLTQLPRINPYHPRIYILANQPETNQMTLA